MPPRVRTTPNAVAQNRKTTLAAETIVGRSAGSVTVRNTCAGEAPSAAAASPGRRSSVSQAAPTVRITTATLKNTRPARIATGVPSKPRNPSGPASPSSCRNATPTTTVGSTNGTSSAARTTDRNGNASRCSAYAAGSPSSTDSAVATAEVHSVNHTTRPTRGRPSTSTTAPGSKTPSGQKPRPSIPATGSTKKTPRTSSGSAARPSSVSGRLILIGR